MARGKVKEIPEESKEPEVSQEVEVELGKPYACITSIMMRHGAINFTNGKAIVSNETAEELKKQGFVK